MRVGRSSSARPDERGAVIPFVAMLTVLVVGMAAFVVDIGMQRVVRRDLQALADVVALDLARLLDGRKARTILAGDATHDSLETAWRKSLVRNDDILGTQPSLEVALVRLDATGAVVVDPTSRQPVRLVGDEVPGAVWVRATGSVDFSFAPGAGAASRTAIGVSESTACFKLGSYAAAVKSGNSVLLERLLGNALSLTGVGYAGLADATVVLGGIAAELGAATPEELLDADVSVARLADATAKALARGSGTATAAQLTVLRTLAAATSVPALRTFKLGRLLALGTAGAAALGARLNVLDLLAAAVFLSNGTNSVKTGVIWNLPAISHTEIALQISEVPQLACGKAGATATTGQLSYSTKLSYQRGSKIAGLEVLTPPELSINVAIARATGTLTSLKCGSGTDEDPDEAVVRVTRDAPTLSFDVPVHLRGEVGTDQLLGGLRSLLERLGLRLDRILELLLAPRSLSVRLDLEFNLGSAAAGTPVASDVTFRHPPMAYDQAVPVPGRSPAAIPHVTFSRAEIRGKAELLVNGVVETTIPLADVDLGFVVTDILNTMIGATVNPLIDKVNSVVTPLSDALGLTLSGADVFVLPELTCGHPALAG